MLSRKKKVQKRFTPIRGKRQKALKIKRFFIILSAVLAFLCVFFVLKKAAGMFFDTEARPAWLEWHIKKINITGEKGDILYEVEKYVSFNEGDALTHSEAAGLERILKANLRELEDISVWRNFFNGNLNIKIRKYQPFARLKTERKNYLMEEGGLVFGDDKSPENDKLMQVSILGQIKGELLPKEFVELIKALKASDILDMQEIIIDIEDESFLLKLKSGNAQMGSVENGPEKLNYLKRVLGESERRGLKKPYNINFDYFNDGKIYLKPTA